MTTREMLDFYGDTAGWVEAKKLDLLCEFLGQDPTQVDSLQHDLGAFLSSRLDDSQRERVMAKFA